MADCRRRNGFTLRFHKTLLKSLQKHCQTVFSRFLATTLGNLRGVHNFPDFFEEASLITEVIEAMLQLVKPSAKLSSEGYRIN
jgi:hypothetical protein